MPSQWPHKTTPRQPPYHTLHGGRTLRLPHMRLVYTCYYIHPWPPFTLQQTLHFGRNFSFLFLLSTQHLGNLGQLDLGVGRRTGHAHVTATLRYATPYTRWGLFSLSHIGHFNLEVGRTGHAHVHLLPAIGVVLGLWSEVDLPAEKEGWMVGGVWVKVVDGVDSGEWRLVVRDGERCVCVCVCVCVCWRRQKRKERRRER